MSKTNNEKENQYWGMCTPRSEWFKLSERSFGKTWRGGRRRRLLFFGVFFTLIGLYWLGRVSGYIEYNPYITRSIFPVIIIVFGVRILIGAMRRKDDSSQEKK